MKSKELPSQDYLKECFDYDPETGLLLWKHRPVHHFKNRRGYATWNARYAGTTALNCVSNGYKVGRIGGVNFLAHRVIYKLLNGTDPEYIDHGEGDRADNRPDSIANATITENNRNFGKSKANKSGTTGVSWDAHRCKWRAWIGDKRDQRYLGRFDNIDDAIAARKAAEVELGYHPNHGRDLQTVTI